MSQPANLPAEWIDEIPVAPSTFKARVASLAAIGLAGTGVTMWIYGRDAFWVMLGRDLNIANALNDAGLSMLLDLWFGIFGIIGLTCLFMGFGSLVLKRFPYRLLRTSLLFIYPTVLGYTILVGRCSSTLVDKELSDRVNGFLMWWQFSWPALAVGCCTLWLHILLRSRSVYAVFTGDTGDAMAGDRVLEDLRTHGRDPRARRSMYWSVFLHVMIIIVLPWLLSQRGCVPKFSVPKGSGVEAVAMVQVKVKKKPKKKKKLKLRKNSAFIFKIPDLFEKTDVDITMDAETQLTYTAKGVPGKLGKGGGKKGGWPEGMENAKVRFPRLQHSGDHWYDGMKQTKADVNFLREFGKVTGFKTATRGESLTIGQLQTLPDDGFPPFLYITGNDMGRLSSSEMKVLRDYCYKGGMIIGDAGSGRFDRSFRDLLRRTFPGKHLIDISDDDVIFQQPTSFPNGAPAFWDHGGRRALGIKHKGRWIVFYHPGDMNDAWKSADFIDVTPEMRRNAMQLGINLVAYAFNQWNDAVARIRKK